MNLAATAIINGQGRAVRAQVSARYIPGQLYHFKKGAGAQDAFARSR
jgi:hypothetical protein